MAAAALSLLRGTLARRAALLARHLPAAAPCPPALGTAGAPRGWAEKAGGKHVWSEEWRRIGLGATKAPAGASMGQVLFIETGFGCDQHGERKLAGSTKAAVRAIRNSIEFNSIPCVADIVPGGRDAMKIHVKLGVPPEYPHVDLEQVAAVFPYGQVMPIEVVPGGLVFGCGRVVKELGDENDDSIIVACAVTIGY